MKVIIYCFRGKCEKVLSPTKFNSTYNSLPFIHQVIHYPHGLNMIILMFTLVDFHYKITKCLICHRCIYIVYIWTDSLCNCTPPFETSKPIILAIKENVQWKEAFYGWTTLCLLTSEHFLCVNIRSNPSNLPKIFVKSTCLKVICTNYLDTFHLKINENKSSIWTASFVHSVEEIHVRDHVYLKHHHIVVMCLYFSFCRSIV